MNLSDIVDAMERAQEKGTKPIEEIHEMQGAPPTYVMRGVRGVSFVAYKNPEGGIYVALFEKNADLFMETFCGHRKVLDNPPTLTGELCVKHGVPVLHIRDGLHDFDVILYTREYRELVIAVTEETADTLGSLLCETPDDFNMIYDIAKLEQDLKAMRTEFDQTKKIVRSLADATERMMEILGIVEDANNSDE